MTPEEEQKNKDDQNLGVLFDQIDNGKSLDEVLHAIADGVLVQDQTRKIVYANRAAVELMGYQENFHVQDQQVQQTLDRFDMYDETGQPLTADDLPAKQALLGVEAASIVMQSKNRLTGQETWSEVKARPIRDNSGRVVYAVSIFRDITMQRQVQAEYEKTNRRNRHILESIADGFFALDQAWKFTYLNKQAEFLLRKTREDLIGRSIFEVFPQALVSDTYKRLQEAMEKGEPLRYEEYFSSNESGLRFGQWIESTVYPAKDGLAVYLRDVTESKQAEESHKFLSEASLLLSSSLEYEITLSRLANLIVPKFADWCTVHVLTEDGTDTKQVVVAHVDPEKVAFAYEAERKFPGGRGPDSGIWSIINTGKSQIFPAISDELMRQSAKSDEHYRLLKSVGLHSVIMVPLCARNKIFGVISLIWAETGKSYSQRDLEMFEELGRRAGMAIDNALLYEESQREIEERKFMEQKLQISEERYRALMDNTSDGVILLNESGKVTFATQAMERILGYSQDQLAARDILEIVHHEDKQIFSDLLDRVRSKPNAQEILQYRCLNAEGDYRWIEGVAVNMLHHENIKSIIVNFRDITARKIAEDSLKYQYHHDALTDLPNRTYLNEQFAEAIATADKNRESVALMLIDLDRFKQINESLGHSLGDRLIQEVALRIRTCVPESCILARLGGDEFGILMPDVRLEEDAAKIANKILEDFRPAFYLDNHEVFISPSIGISMYPYDGKEAANLFRNAEAALYRAKDYGRNTYQFYTTTMNAAAFERLTLESKLRHAIENREFVLFYQPQVDVTTGKIVGTEELIRWQRQDMTLVLPDRFIPLAEANGLIEPIGEWILAEALRQGKIWHDAGFRLVMAINLSARQFKQKNFEKILITAIENSKFDPRFLELELTESVLAENPENVINIMNALRERGVRFCLDDFSTGYSSLRYIKQFPVDMLKIERTFMKGIPHDVQNAAIAKSIITLGQSLGMEVTAEGVESKNQLAFLRDHLCNRAQGYLFNGAMPAHSLTEILDEDRYVSVVANLGKPPLF